jgi:hypothetical protein
MYSCFAQKSALNRHITIHCKEFRGINEEKMPFNTIKLSIPFYLPGSIGDIFVVLEKIYLGQ